MAAGLPRFMNVPGEHLLGILSANEFLTRVNLMQAHKEEYETPLPETRGKQVIVIGGGNTAMDAARTARRLGGNVTIVYRRTQDEMPVRVEELHHALEEGIELKVLRAPREFIGSDKTHFVTHTLLDVMELGEPDASGRRRPLATGETEEMRVDLVIMALGNASNPIVKDAEPELKTSKWGTIEIKAGTHETSVDGVFTGGDANRGGSTAIKAAGDGQAAAREIAGEVPFSLSEIKSLVDSAERYTQQGQTPQKIVEKIELAEGIVEFLVHSPLIAKAAKTENKFDDILYPLLRKSLKLFIIIFAVLYGAASLNIELALLLASLGIGGLAVVAVNQWEDPDLVFEFTGRLSLEPTFSILLDRECRIAEQCSVKGLPATFLLDKEGNIRFRAIGGREFDHPAVESLIEGLL